ncbi:acyltransferase [Yimella sp. cx-573]|nr:acyltransferase [Yimella sp. cx-573]
MRVGGPAAAEPAAKKSYVSGLDGLRAVAVIAVIAYHLDLSWARGGFLGVDVFFVISGYLITSQLWVRARSGQAAVHLGSFWQARARRLLPALVAVLIATTLAQIVLGREQLRPYLGDLGAAASYTSNWWYVLHERSYFEAFGRPPALQHLWSLAVEEQFYLFWPLVIAAVAWMFRRSVVVRRRALFTLCLLIAAASAIWMAFGTWRSGAPLSADASRFYFGTDSHSSGLLLGAALAVWRDGAGFGSSVPALRPARWVTTLLGVAALGVVVWSFWAIDSWSVPLYRYGFAALGVVTAVLIAAATRPGPLARALDLPLLAAIGRRSYGLYLWHWPVFVFTRPGVDVPLTGHANIALRLALTAVLAEISYQAIEQPIRALGVRGAWRQLRTHRLGRVARPAFVALLVAVTAAAASAATLKPAATATDGGITVAVEEPETPTPSTKPSTAAPSTTTTSTSVPSPTSSVTIPSSTSAQSTSPTSSPVASSTTGTTTSSPRTSSSTTASETRSADGQTAGMSLTVYGDSFAIGASNGLKRRFASVDMHAVVGEQAYTLINQLAAQASSIRTDVLLIHTGNNGVVDSSALAAAIAKVPPGVKVVLAYPRVPRPWQGAVLSQLRAVAASSPRVRVADWYGLANGQPGWFADGVHPNGAGVREYGNLIQRTVLGG